eukprot:3089910-Rhodomonas_salina.2
MVSGVRRWICGCAMRGPDCACALPRSLTSAASLRRKKSVLQRRTASSVGHRTRRNSVTQSPRRTPGSPTAMSVEKLGSERGSAERTGLIGEENGERGQNDGRLEVTEVLFGEFVGGDSAEVSPMPVEGTP